MYNYKVITKNLLGDIYTPVSVYLRLRDASTKSILMESTDYHTGRNAKSFIAMEPVAQVSISHGIGKCEFPDSSVYQHEISRDYRSDAIINKFLGSFSFGEDASTVQLWGFTAFNAVRYFEDINVKDETLEKNDAPDMVYTLFKYVVEFDHFRNRMAIHEIVADGEESDIRRVETLLQKQITLCSSFKPVGEVTSPLTDEQHKENIRRGIAHCKRGDVFQIVLSRRFVQKYQGDDIMLYRALREINPSPYLFYMDFGGFRIFGSSPETHCRIEGGKAFIDPIAGTTRRTG
ncbi:MAG: chorismate-binding protein, partial [Bacteroidales bacterium]|nr:chorismate-binding protein [Bacteroidales bacterium]